MKNKKKKTFKLPFKNNEQLALYYCKLAGVEKFRDLEKNEIYWKHYQDDLKLLYQNKLNENDIPIPNDFNISNVLYCEKCQYHFAFIFGKKILTDMQYSYQNHNGIFKFICECGHKNSLDLKKLTKSKR